MNRKNLIKITALMVLTLIMLMSAGCKSEKTESIEGSNSSSVKISSENTDSSLHNNASERDKLGSSENSTLKDSNAVNSDNNVSADNTADDELPDVNVSLPEPPDDPRPPIVIEIPNDSKKPDNSGNKDENVKPDADPDNPQKQVDYETYNKMTGEEQEAFYNSFKERKDFFIWYNEAKKKYEDSKNEIIIDGSTNIEIKQ